MCCRACVVDWASNFAPSNGANHAHFFWDIYEPSQAGSNAANRSPWELTSSQPFTASGELSSANRPAGANGICVTPANSSHAVIDANNYHCVQVDAGGEWIALAGEQVEYERLTAERG